VSNSSSSSFILLLNDEPKNADEIRELVFGERKELHSEYGDSTWDTQTVAEIIFRDMMNGKATVEDMANELTSGWFLEEVINKHLRTGQKVDWNAYHKEMDEAAEKYTKKYLEGKEDYHIYIVEYSDNDGELYTTMEHGDIFHRIDNIRISKH